MALDDIIYWEAFGACNGAIPAPVLSHGCGVAHSGVGIWLVTLDQAIARQSFASVVGDSLNAGAPAATLTNYKIIHTSDTQKEIRYFDTAALADGIFFTFAFGRLRGDLAPTECCATPEIIEDPFTVDNFTELASIPAGTIDGTTVLVKTVDDTFTLDVQSTLTPVAGEIIAWASGGNWLRRYVGSTRWANQADWEYNNTTGDDENDGTAAVHIVGTRIGPIKTLREFSRRMVRSDLSPGVSAGYSIHLGSDVPSSDTLRFASLPGPGNGDDVDTLELDGDEVVVVSGTFAAVTVGASGALGGTRSTFDGGVGFVAAAHIGQFVKVTSGVANGKMTSIGQSMGGQVAQVGDWNNGFGGVNGVVPAPGDTYSIVRHTVFAGRIKWVGTMTDQLLILSDIDSDGTHDWIVTNAKLLCFSCSVRGAAFVDTCGDMLSMNNCFLNSSIGSEFAFIGLTQYSACVIVHNVFCLEVGRIQLANTCVIGGRIEAGQAVAPDTDVREPASYDIEFQQAGSGSGVSVWDAPAGAGAVLLGRGGRAYCSGNLYGSSVLPTAGVSVRGGALLMIQNAKTPTITSGHNIDIDGNANIPIIGAGGVPGVGAPITDWLGAGQWADPATYNRNAHNLVNGSRIISVA